MNVMQEFPALAPPRRGSRRQTAMIGIILLCVAIIAALIATAIYMASSDSHHTPSIGIGKKLKLDIRDFQKAPGANAALLVTQTAVDKDAFQPLTAEAAQLANAKIPVTRDPGPAAQSLAIPFANGEGYVRALDCLTAAVYYEAANEPVAGQRAVAQVVLNRMRHVVYPHTVCGVVFQGSERQTGCQFSFTCDGSLLRTPSSQGWNQARAIARMALAGLVYAPVGLATHYHADYVFPYWAPTLTKQMVIARHIFYRWPGTWGTPISFHAAYDRAEPDIWGKAALAIAPLSGDAPDAALLDNAATLTNGPRPVLSMQRAVPAAGATAVPAPAAKNDRAYMAARQPPLPVQSPREPESVTGGVIMAGGCTGNNCPR